MRKFWGALALAGALVFSGAAPAQVAAVLQADGASNQFLLVPDAGSGQAPPPLFLGQGPGGQPLQAAGGTVNNLSTNQLGNLQIGFCYLRPLWSFRDFTLAVPAAAAPNFPLLGDTGHVDDHFAFAPVVNYHYQFADSLYGVGASGIFLNLSGQLQRQLGSTSLGLGELNANSQLTLVSANLLEFTRTVPLGDDGDGGGCGKKQKGGGDGWLGDTDLDLSIGSRYSSISQSYTGSLTSAATFTTALPGTVAPATNSSTRYSSQSFSGFGLTAAAALSRPVGADWLLFASTRGSVLIGSNQKDSTLTVNVAGQPGTTSTINETKTDFIPIIETQFGAEWGMLLGSRAPTAAPQSLFTLRVAFVGQFWGDVGPLSAGSSQGFRQSDLFLLGVTVQAGFQR